MDKLKYSPDEMMISTASHNLQDYDVCIAGQGLPIVAAAMAKALYFPHIILCTEAGLIDFDPYIAPQHIADPCCTRGFAANADLVDMFTRYTGAGYVDTCFLGCAQIDKYGNINSSLIGDYFGDFSVRFPGAGGAPDFMAYSLKTILTMRGGQFVEKLDYLTSPGYLTGGNSRYEAGMPEGTGPSALITLKGVFRFEPDTKEIYLAETFPGVTIDDIKADVPWDLKVADDVHAAPYPAEQEIYWIRDFDPLSAVGKSLSLQVLAIAMGKRNKMRAERLAEKVAAKPAKRASKKPE
jgi:glutaconate CoA-transferase subunit B